VATGGPRELYFKPQDTYVARMVGSPPINFLKSDVASDGSLSLPFGNGSLKANGFASGQSVTFGIRPHDIHLGHDVGPDAIRFPARIHLTEPLGDVTIIDVAVRDEILKLVLPEETAANYSVGDEIEIGFDPTDTHLFSAETGARSN
jgi:multiple sugar transport system ATP-binding protein